jgi:hypothetical protein
MKNNKKYCRKIIAVIGIALLVTGIGRTGEATEFADKSKFTKIEIPAALGSVSLLSGINPQGDIVGTYFFCSDGSCSPHGFLLSK